MPKITALPAAASGNLTDLLAKVNDPSGVPVTQKLTLQQIINLIQSTGLNFNSGAIVLNTDGSATFLTGANQLSLQALDGRLRLGLGIEFFPTGESHLAANTNPFNVSDTGVVTIYGGLYVFDSGAFTINGTTSIDTVGNISIGSGTTVLNANGNIGFFASAATTQQSVAALTNNVTSGGTADTLDDFTDLNTYSVDAATIRNDIYQLGQKVEAIRAALANYGLVI